MVTCTVGGVISRILFDRQLEHRHHAEDERQHGDHIGKDRVFDEESREHGLKGCRVRFRVQADIAGFVQNSDASGVVVGIRIRTDSATDFVIALWFAVADDCVTGFTLLRAGRIAAPRR